MSNKTPTLTELLADGLDFGDLSFPDSGPDNTVERAAVLAEEGSKRVSTAHGKSGRVAALLTNDRSSVAVVLGAVTTHTPLVSIPLPARGQDLDAYRASVVAIARQTATSSILVDNDYRPLVESLALNRDGIDLVPEVPDQGSLAPTTYGDGFELVQFTSGSTGPPKGVRLDDAALGANIAATLDMLDVGPGDNVCSWLPLSHDMGLVGMLLASICSGSRLSPAVGTLTVLKPESFLRSPLRWIEMIGATRSTITATPDFGLRRCIAAVEAHERPKVDLTPLRAVVVGGEIVRPATLSRFEEWFGPDGLSATTLCPAYGLAEAGLAVSVSRPTERWHFRSIADEEVTGIGSDAFVSLGTPLPGYSIDTHNDDCFGPVAVRGPSVASSYLDGSASTDDAGWLPTADLGYLSDGGELYIAGRLDDVVVSAGKNLYAPAIDTSVEAIPAACEGRVATVSLPDGTWGVIAETNGGDRLKTADARTAATRACGSTPDFIVVVPRGSLPMTASGKHQRRAAASHLLSGRFTIIDSAGW